MGASWDPHDEDLYDPNPETEAQAEARHEQDAVELYWVEDPAHPHAGWRAEVAAGDTLLGYHEWVRRQREHTAWIASGQPDPF